MGKIMRALTAGGHKNILKHTVGTIAGILFGITAMAGFAAAATNTAPKISGTPKTSIPAYGTYRFYPTASDADGDTLNFTILNRPSWAEFSYGSGSLKGTPTKTGTWSNIQIFVSDGTVTRALPAFSIKVTSATNTPLRAPSPRLSAISDVRVCTLAPT